jgi:hypothetical protein
MKAKVVDAEEGGGRAVGLWLPAAGVALREARRESVRWAIACCRAPPLGEEVGSYAERDGGDEWELGGRPEQGK